jgi:protocatechuate 3,4-dioxygenase beta subunit
MFLKSLPIVVFACCFLLFVPAVLHSQGETTSAIVGQVTDATGAAVPGALVSISNLETGLQRSVTTDSQGRCDFPQLKPGTYSIKVSADGFDPQQNHNVAAGLGQKEAVNFTLKPAKSHLTVEVTPMPSMAGKFQELSFGTAAFLFRS